jgi:acyl-CoA synthetase (NDP forming)
MMAKTIREQLQTTTSPDLPETAPTRAPMIDHSFTLQAVMEMQKTLSQLTQAVAGLTEQSKANSEKLDNISHKFYASQMGEIKKMMETVLSSKNDPNFVDLRNISRDEAKLEISHYFKEHDGEEIGYDDLIENLGIEPTLVLQICQELLEEGKIG